jgi:hypothetical protein
MKRAFRVGQVGDVVHFSRFFDEFCSYRDNHRDIWGVVTEREGPNWLRVLLVTGIPAGQVHTTDDSDVGRIVKPKDVPDYVWSRIAFYKLIGAGDAD